MDPESVEVAVFLHLSQPDIHQLPTTTLKHLLSCE